jgi:hypothetical protein
MTTYYLTDGKDIYKIRSMSFVQMVLANNEAFEATDGNVWWASIVPCSILYKNKITIGN